MKRLLCIILAVPLLLAACGTGIGSSAGGPTWQEQYDLGVRYLSEGNYEEAIIAFTVAIEIDPKQADAYIGLADAYEALGDVEQARQVLENALAVVTDVDVIRSRLDGLGKESVVSESTPEAKLEPTHTNISDIFDSLILYAWDSSYQTTEYTFFFPNGVGIHYNGAFPGVVPYENYFSYEIKDNSVILTYSEWFGTDYVGSKTWMWDDATESLIYTFEEYGGISTQTITSLPVAKVFYDWTDEIQIEGYNWTNSEQDYTDYWKNLVKIMITYYSMTLNSQEYALLLDEQSTWESKLMQDISDFGVDSNTETGAKWINVRMKNRIYDLLLLLPGIDSFDIPSKLPVNEYAEWSSDLISEEEALRIVEEKSGYYDGQAEGEEYVIQIWYVGQQRYNDRHTYVYQIRRLMQIEGPQLTSLIETVYVDTETGEAFWESPFGFSGTF